MHRECIAVHIIWDFYHLIPVLGVVFIRGEQAFLVPAMRAANKYGFVPEADGGAECVTLARGEVLFAVFADIFFFRGVLCRYYRGDAEPKKEAGRYILS